MGAPYALSSDLVSAWPAKSLEVAQYIDGQLPLIAMTQNAQTGTTYSLAATDFTKLVTLSNASPVTVTVPLESSVAWVAGTQLRLMNLGAGVVTVVGAGGVTINGSPLTLAQYKEGTLTKTGTNIWTFVGSPSAPGMDLITPTSVAGSGVTLSGGQVTFTAATTMSANGVFTSAYDNYMIQFNATAATLADNITCRLRLSSTDASTNYKSSIAYMAYASNAVAGLAYGATQWEPGRASATLGSSFVMWIQNPAVAARTMMNYLTNDADTNSRIGGGLHSTATAYDGITFAIATGNLTGTLRVYGMRNS